MKFFSNITSLSDLKQQYRQLVFIHHPDKGGNTADMQALNSEFTELFKVWEHRTPQTCNNGYNGYENDYSGSSYSEYTSYVYNEYKYRGSKYNGQCAKEVTKIIRMWIKETYPHYKFSVTYRDYKSISISLISADFFPFKDGSFVNCSVNHYHIDKNEKITDRAKEVFKNIYIEIKKYHMDDSDSMTDYFYTNFYLQFSIGRYNKKYEYKPIEIGKKKSTPRVVKTELEKAMGKNVFQKITHQRYGEINVLGEITYHENGAESFYANHYSGYKTALKRLEKLQNVGIQCEIKGSYIIKI